jgi:hypothetical protein
MYRFLANNRDELIKRCTEKVAKRPLRHATTEQLRNGVPMFLDQLTRTLEAEQDNGSAAGLKISGASGGDGAALSEMGVSAAAHGTNLLKLGYTVDQVVHDYGDLCQAITDLAFERDAAFSVDEFRTLNRCLDNAIADAVTEFSFQRDANTRGCVFTVTDVDPLLGVEGNRDLLLAALANLLHNAFKFTQPQSEVTLNAYALGDRILIDIKDHCGGLPPGNAEKMFTPFTQRGEDKTGLGLGLSISRQSVSADGGLLSVTNMPGIGCTFTINLPRCALQ